MTQEPTRSPAPSVELATELVTPPPTLELATEIAPHPPAPAALTTEIALPTAVVPTELPTQLTPAPAVGDGIPPETLIINTYQIKRLLGGGGMGEVYLARHAGLGTEHAIKVIRPSMGDNTQVMDLFYREARVLRGVRHDAVVNYDGFVRDAQGRDYLVMEYVEGIPLSDRLKHQPLTIAEVLTLRDRLCAGLAAAHRQGAVHRDLSPDNVILPNGEIAAAKLIDFGLCKLTDPEQKTIVGTAFAGKYRYAAPEQFGMFGGVVDARTDIYSLGLVLVAAATGQPLDMGSDFMDALRCRQKVPDLSAVSPALREWLQVMLQPDPAARPESVETLVERWPAKTMLAAQPTTTGKTPDETAMGAWVTRHEPKTPSGRRWLLAVGAALVLAGISASFYWILRPLDTPLVATPAPVVSAPVTPIVTTPPVAATDELDALIQAGRLEDAAALVQTRYAAGNPPAPTRSWALIERLGAANKRDAAFTLIRLLANNNDGAACLTLGEFYDPKHWSAATSPFSKPNLEKARDWYQRAAELGVAAASERLNALLATENPR
ncbi:protein kinase [Chromatium okenii]|uniref:protein kinase domain-containing protein n=1 Tax=Chromatium okenii TaxID=61644 RepID=UPI0026EE2D5A|nr:protein kinase [Chromatium okenii]MBV5308801.1 protein kinase [Chromatium okenii]